MLGDSGPWNVLESVYPCQPSETRRAHSLCTVLSPQRLCVASSASFTATMPAGEMVGDNPQNNTTLLTVSQHLGKVLKKYTLLKRGSMPFQHETSLLFLSQNKNQWKNNTPYILSLFRKIALQKSMPGTSFSTGFIILVVRRKRNLRPLHFMINDL